MVLEYESLHLPQKSTSFVGIHIPAPWFASGLAKATRRSKKSSELFPLFEACWVSDLPGDGDDLPQKSPYLRKNSIRVFAPPCMSENRIYHSNCQLILKGKYDKLAFVWGVSSFKISERISSSPSNY